MGLKQKFKYKLGLGTANHNIPVQKRAKKIFYNNFESLQVHMINSEE